MDKAYREAKKRVKKKKIFYKSVMSYVAISLFLIFINVFTSPHYMWCWWAIVPWGFAIVMQGIHIATSNKSNDWEQREMRKELKAMGRDPEDYLDDQLELRNLEKEELSSNYKGYKNSDLV